jgi:hypothetical protein
MDRVIQGFVRGDARQAQVLAEGDKQRVVNGAVVFCGDFQARFEEAPGRLNVNRDAQELVQKLMRLIQCSQPAVEELPNSIGNFNESQIQNNKPFVFQRDFGDQPISRSADQPGPSPVPARSIWRPRCYLRPCHSSPPVLSFDRLNAQANSLILRQPNVLHRLEHTVLVNGVNLGHDRVTSFAILEAFRCKST